MNPLLDHFLRPLAYDIDPILRMNFCSRRQFFCKFSSVLMLKDASHTKKCRQWKCFQMLIILWMYNLYLKRATHSSGANKKELLDVDHKLGTEMLPIKDCKQALTNYKTTDSKSRGSHSFVRELLTLISARSMGGALCWSDMAFFKTFLNLTAGFL